MSREMSSQARAAKMIRAYMKANGIAGSVRSDSFAGGDSVSIRVEDLQPVQYNELKDYANQFQYGHFDGMIDLYEYSNRRDDIPQVKFVSIYNKMSDQVAQAIYDFIKGYYAGMEGAPESFADAGNFYNQNFGAYASNLVYRLFNGGYNSNQYYESIGVIAVEEFS